jgi:hypothetical protein
MNSRFASLIASIRIAIKNEKSILRVPGNQFSMAVLKKFREMNYIGGFSITLNSMTEGTSGKNKFRNDWHGYPHVTIFFHMAEGEGGNLIFEILRLYPRSPHNYIAISWRRIRKLISSPLRKADNTLISTSSGLLWSQSFVKESYLERTNVNKKRIGGILILDINIR